MPDLTPEQKEHLKMAHRANMRIEETWSLFCMYLSQDKNPHDALDKAREAVTVWSEWMDENEVEPPDIPRPDFSNQITDAMKNVMATLGKTGMPQGLAPSDALAAFSAGAALAVDAEFKPGLTVVDLRPADEAVPPLTSESSRSSEDEPTNIS